METKSLVEVDFFQLAVLYNSLPSAEWYRFNSHSKSFRAFVTDTVHPTFNIKENPFDEFKYIEFTPISTINGWAWALVNPIIVK